MQFSYAVFGAGECSAEQYLAGHTRILREDANSKGRPATLVAPAKLLANVCLADIHHYAGKEPVSSGRGEAIPDLRYEKPPCWIAM